MDFPSAESGILDRNESSHSPASPALGKVCIVYAYQDSKRYDYAIFIVDLASPLPVLDDDGYIRTAPAFFLDIDLTSARKSTFFGVCVLNSTMYLFQRASADDLFGRKSVYTYDLSPHLEEQDQFKSITNVKVVKKSMLSPATEMWCSKYSPVALPTPDGKNILVFSTVFCYHPCDRYPEFTDFELFHPPEKKKSKKKKSKKKPWKTNPWKKLPSLRQYLSKIGVPSAKFYINFYGFITSSTFLIHIKFGFFTLDIDLPEPVWQKRGGSNMHVPSDGPVFGIESDMLWLTTSGAYDAVKGYDAMFDASKLYSFPRSTFGNAFSPGAELFCDVHTVYDKHGKLFGIVKLHMGMGRCTRYLHIFLDICSFDLHKYRNDKKTVGADARLETSIFKSFKFVIGEEECVCFRPICFYPIHEGTK